MADVEPVATNVDLRSHLSSPQRDFLVRNNGDQVKVAELEGKIVCLYFSAAWCSPCRSFTPKLCNVYGELLPNGGFEFVYVSLDKDEESFNGYFSKMPWLAVPFSDAASRKHLKDRFVTGGIPHLVVLGSAGDVLSVDGVHIVRSHGAGIYPFTPERFREIEEVEAAAKANQTLRSVLTSGPRDYMISNNGTKVPITELEGKIVGLCFSVYNFGPSREFTEKVVGVYNKLQERGERFEVVTIALDDDEKSFEEGLKNMPWLSLPFKDDSAMNLVRYFELKSPMTLVILGPDGKTLLPNAADLVEVLGDEAWPFSLEKLQEFKERKKAKLKDQTLESLLISGDLDFVIEKNGGKRRVRDLVGKNICLYFAAKWSPPCMAFLPKLIKAYGEIKAKDEGFEVIYVSLDENKASFEDHFASMPWPALPYGDERKRALSETFDIQDGLPLVAAIGRAGQIVTKEAKDLVEQHGSDAYPFTDDHLKGIKGSLLKQSSAN